MQLSPKEITANIMIKTSDLIWDSPVSSIQYFSNLYTANVGSISNKESRIKLLMQRSFRKIT
ncbi:hypothetical protein CS542_06005 [Pedobacter sp. IW39]|nr:hypothetical protein CS542_06005 [Pedobacter sp. IW39]